MADTAIEWASKVWNPTTGCDRVSAGCDNCYALTMAKRLKGMGSAKYQTDGDPKTSGPGFGIAEHSGALGLPYGWKKPERIFVNSMSDLFHAGVSDGFIARVWEVMAQCPHHTFMVLTKRPARMRSWLTRWHDNTGDDDVQGDGLPPMPRGPEAVRAVYSSPRARLFADMLDSMGTPPEGAAYPLYDWMEGPRWFPRPLANVITVVSVEDQKTADNRIPALLDTPSAWRGISAEPLLGSIDLRGEWAWGPGIDWIIVGGESGPGARPMHPDWVRSLRDQRGIVGAALFFKQWGEWSPVGDLRGHRSIVMTDDGNTYGPGDLDWPDGPRRGEAYAANFNRHRPTFLYRTGKKAAGRELDGRTWDEFPT